MAIPATEAVTSVRFDPQTELELRDTTARNADLTVIESRFSGPALSASVTPHRGCPTSTAVVRGRPAQRRIDPGLDLAAAPSPVSGRPPYVLPLVEDSQGDAGPDFTRPRR